eukprot:scaffold121586_cov20-Prasinocladus_malaysianus.AAC.4
MFSKGAKGLHLNNFKLVVCDSVKDFQSGSFPPFEVDAGLSDDAAALCSHDLDSSDGPLTQDLFVARSDNCILVDVLLHIKGFESQTQSLAGPNYLPEWMTPAARVAAVRIREKGCPQAQTPLGRQPLTLIAAIGAKEQNVGESQQAPPASL